MGLSLFHSSGLDYDVKSDTTPNPNKYNFTIEKFHEAGEYLVLLVNYPHCTTFGGDKVVVLNDYITYQEVTHMAELDPHFLEDNKVFMRFRGDDFTKACNVVDLIVVAKNLSKVSNEK